MDLFSILTCLLYTSDVYKRQDILHPARYAVYAGIKRKNWHYQNGHTCANVDVYKRQLRDW